MSDQFGGALAAARLRVEAEMAQFENGLRGQAVLRGLEAEFRAARARGDDIPLLLARELSKAGSSGGFEAVLDLNRREAEQGAGAVWSQFLELKSRLDPEVREARNAVVRLHNRLAREPEGLLSWLRADHDARAAAASPAARPALDEAWSAIEGRLRRLSAVLKGMEEDGAWSGGPDGPWDSSLHGPDSRWDARASEAERALDIAFTTPDPVGFMHEWAGERREAVLVAKFPPPGFRPATDGERADLVRARQDTLSEGGARWTAEAGAERARVTLGGVLREARDFACRVAAKFRG